ncbi:MAG TPA: 3-phosphoshikimate 1-carboxyvinyltransferase [Vicinamibacterales bacterium]|nr:3-phosphoshikimate 1-carboxyvinyltransferase [Vicinamibacterales bacterium]
MPSISVATIVPARRVRGRLTVPGDKSISHRYAILAALAQGRSTITNFAPGADCRSTLACLRGLGVDVRDEAAGTVSVMGRGPDGLRSPESTLDAGNSGTTIRLLAGVLAAQAFSTTIAGDASLSRRPMRRVIEPLTQMGARFESVDGHPPLTIHGGILRGINYAPPVPSAQVKSAVLLAGLRASGTTSVTESSQTRDHTERALTAFGGRVAVTGPTVAVEGGQEFAGRALLVPGDFSSAAFWMVAAAAMPGSRVAIEHVGLNPTRFALLGVLRRFGARVDVTEETVDAGEPRGTVTVAYDHTRTLAIAPDEVPALIDELPAIAALAAVHGEVVVRGAAELRVKESDRIAVLVAGFRALGVDADERPDGFIVHGSGSPPRGGVADARGDHRMAMAFAVAALAARQPSTVEGADAVVISYPGFFQMLHQLTR